jgi:chemotaxis methyl-accepting protein methylase
MPIGEATPTAPSVDELVTAELAELHRVLQVVRERTGIDFGGYRLPTLARRIQNRMIARNVRTLPEYLERLREEPGEPAALIEKLTIKVSRFFRNASTFEALGRALTLRRAARPTTPLTVWSAGCGFGEEPYSLALLLSELGAAPAPGELLGTDVDPAALAFARQARYPASALEELDAGRRERWFETSVEEPGSGYTVKPELRARVELRLHDLAGSRSAPDQRKFDLVCCRNVLIYLQPALQEKVEVLLMYSLQPGGLLCLGEAEWLLPSLTPYFEVVDRKARIFRRREHADDEGTR